jgi:tol-pal system protein YbgF
MPSCKEFQGDVPTCQERDFAMNRERTRDGLAAAGLAITLTMSFGWLAIPDVAGAQQSWNRPAVSESAAKKAPAKRSQSAASSAGDGSLRQRVEGLEEQLVDLQVVIGTLESLARSGGSSSASPAYRGGGQTGGALTGPDAGRIAALETQVQALTAQLERMSDELRAYRSGAAPAPAPRAQSGGYRGPAPSSGGFNTTVTDNRNDPIGNLITDNRAPPPPPSTIGLPPQVASADARQSYEMAYANLLQQNYPAAETGFADFLQRYPDDELAANAQFWLGETYFVRGQWDNAAAAFLKVAQKHARSDKAPDSLAKLAMSMERKGNRQAACRALAELNARFPNPPAHVKRWETTERRRAGCA